MQKIICTESFDLTEFTISYKYLWVPSDFFLDIIFEKTNPGFMNLRAIVNFY